MRLWTFVSKKFSEVTSSKTYLKHSPCGRQHWCGPTGIAKLIRRL